MPFCTISFKVYLRRAGRAQYVVDNHSTGLDRAFRRNIRHRGVSGSGKGRGSVEERSSSRTLSPLCQIVQSSPAMQTLSCVRHGVACREMNIVVEVARTFLSGGDDGFPQAALVHPVDWAAVEHRADDHSMMPLVACALKQCSGDLVPREIRERFQQRLLHSAHMNMVWLQEWRRILLAFEAAGVSTISLKGPALALLAYRNIALREFADLDLLIRPDDVLMARDILVREGYQLRFPLSGDTDAALLRSRNRQLDFVNDGRGTLIDLHWGALHEMFSFQLPVDQLFKSAQVEHREEISFLSLSPEYLLLYLCVHGTKHCWLNLRELCDVACYVQAAQKLDWELCIRHAEAANCDMVLKHSVLLAQQVLGLELSSPIRNYCEDAEAQALAEAASALLFREGDLGYREALRYHLAFAKGWRHRVQLVFERVFVPSEPEWQEVRLPQSLYFLYYAVRPIRFMLERLSKVNRKSRIEGRPARETH
jgi:Uncharacterised nucleotidyltransferase